MRLIFKHRCELRLYIYISIFTFNLKFWRITSLRCFHYVYDSVSYSLRLLLACLCYPREGVVGVASLSALRNAGLPALCPFTDARYTVLPITYIWLQRLALSDWFYLILPSFTWARGLTEMLHPVSFPTFSVLTVRSRFVSSCLKVGFIQVEKKKNKSQTRWLETYFWVLLIINRTTTSSVFPSEFLHEAQGVCACADAVN